MCVSWKNTLIRIINELWVEKWGVVEQTRILLVRNTAIHCQRVLAIKKPNCNGSLMKTNILCNPQGGNDYEWGAAPSDPSSSGFPEKESVSGNRSVRPRSGTRGRGPARRTFPEESDMLPGFSVNGNWPGKVVRGGTWGPRSLSPTLFGRCFFLETQGFTNQPF